ncbi:MAG TPA: LysM peptidoglycan-binding domain-containing protein [Clostridiales bacterium]|nr:LysM peptidoglycan-binding domain-containing protein [Clostridiales bacterium]
MSKYAIIFQKNNSIIRLPVNPEELEVSSSQAIARYEILKLGQIAIPTHMELTEYSFHAEFPHDKNHYIESSKDFKDASSCLKQFNKWRLDLEPIRFMAGKVFTGSKLVDSAINTLVLIEGLTVTEKAGEEEDKYVTFKVLEYNPYTIKVINRSNTSSNPKSTGYHVVKSGDTLWGIAKKYYGDGAKYTKIYNANKSIIKNPSLIYPGQKLVIPE